MAGITEIMAHLKVPNWIALILRVVIAAIFIYAGISKALIPLRFVTDIDNFHLLPWMVTAPLAFYLPWLEIFCGVSLLLFQLDRGALLTLLVLTFVFVLALASARIRGLDITCGCFGHATRDLSLASHLALNVAIIVILLFLLRTNSFAKRPQRPAV
jgi:putative oxidoreductase